jgi:hypothetical protein
MKYGTWFPGPADFTCKCPGCGGKLHTAGPLLSSLLMAEEADEPLDGETVRMWSAKGKSWPISCLGHPLHPATPPVVLAGHICHWIKAWQLGKEGESDAAPLPLT